MAPSQQSSFPIPSSLHDLERDPYNLLPYPFDFNDEDEAARADSFLELVHRLEQGNRTLSTGGICLFEPAENEEDDAWMNEDRVQALYTLVRYVCNKTPREFNFFINQLIHPFLIAENRHRLLRKPEHAWCTLFVRP